MIDHPNAPTNGMHRDVPPAAPPPPPSGSGPKKPRVLPHNLDLEASVIGGVIMHNEALADLAEVETDDFYDMRHKVVWQAIRNLESRLVPIDVVTVEAEVEKQGKLDAVGGIAFITELALRVPTVDNIREYRDQVRALSRNRRAIIAISDALEDAWNWPHDPAELVAEIGGKLARIEHLGRPAEKRIKLITVGEALEDLSKLSEAPVYPTPFPTLNDAIGFGGFLGTQVYTVAAGTGRGKTTWVSAIAAHAAQTVPVLVVSYEMKPGYFVARRAAGVLGVHSNEIIRGSISMGAVLRAIPDAKLRLMHRPPLAELRVAVDVMAQKFGAAPLVIVDYIQKLADEIALTQVRPDLRIATSQASATLCDIAEKAGACVIAVSAIGRGKGKLMTEPRKAEPYELVEVAKESGAVEYDGAGMIVLTLSKEYDGEDRIATMTLAKARFGEEIHIDARYNGRRGMWRDCGRVDQLPAAAVVGKPGRAPATDSSAVAAEVLAALQKHGPQKSKAAIWKLTRKGKAAVLSEVDALVAEERIRLTQHGYALAEQVDQTPVQTEVPGTDSGGES